MTKNKNGFFELKEILGSQVSETFFKKMHSLQSLQTIWQETVGEFISKHAKVLYAKEDKLFIGVSQSVWMNEINLQKSLILQKINEKTGSNLQDLVLKISTNSSL